MGTMEGINALNRRLSSINRRSILNQMNNLLDDHDDEEKEQEQRVLARTRNIYDQNVYERVVVRNAMFALDLFIVVVRRELDQLLPRLSQINFKELCHNIYYGLSDYFRDNFNWIMNALFGRRKARALHGKEAISTTDLLRYKGHSYGDADIDTDTDDAISLGASTVGISTVKNADLEAELAKIRDSMADVFKDQMAKMQATIDKQAEVIGKQAEVNNEILRKLDTMMQQQLNTPQAASMTPAPSMSNMPALTSTPAISRTIPRPPPMPATLNTNPPKAPPLPPSLFGKPCSDRANTSCTATLSEAPAKKPSVTSFSKSSGKENQHPDDALGYDYISELAAQLRKRREVIEKDDLPEYKEPERPKKVLAANSSIVSSMLARIPEPSSPLASKFNESRGSACSTGLNDDDWDE